MIAVVILVPGGWEVDAEEEAAPAENCEGVPVAVGADVHALLADHGEGTAFCFAPGVHRIERPLAPQDGQRLVGTGGAVISGAKVIEGFVAEGPNFVASGFLPPEPNRHGQCLAEGCSFAEDMFLDGRPLRRVLDLLALAPGAFYQDYTLNRVYLRDDPSGRLVEQSYALSLVDSKADDVTIEDLVFEKAAGKAQFGAIRGIPGWLIQHNEVHHNHGQGIRCVCVVRRNYVHHNGQLGVGGAGEVGGWRGGRYEENEIAYNNTAGYDPLWEAGGSKWAWTSGLVLRGNYVHHNYGPGLWTDINNKDVLIENNYVADNDRHGIYHEISYEADIRDNLVLGNGLAMPRDLDGWGGAAIRISASPGVTVRGNRLVGNRNGIIAMQQERQEYPDPSGRPHEIRDLIVSDNDISMTKGMTGLVEDVGDPSYFRSRNNRFVNNRYHLDSETASRFTWEGKGHAVAAWKGFGHDQSGQFDTAVADGPPPPKLDVGPRNQR